MDIYKVGFSRQHPQREIEKGMAEKVDVLICGSGSAGVCAALWLSIYGIKCKVLEKRDGPLKMGQADGVQCRTVEIFESFNISEELLRESYHVLEVAFWSAATPEKGPVIKRIRRAADTAPGLSHQPHVILNQARINGLLIQKMQQTSSQEIDYGYSVKSVKVDEAMANDPDAYCVEVVAESEGKEETFKAKYVLVSALTMTICVKRGLKISAHRVVMVHTATFEDPSDSR